MLISLSQAMSPQVVKPLSLMHGQSNVKATVTSAATEHHLQLDSSIMLGNRGSNVSSLFTVIMLEWNGLVKPMTL